MAHERNTGGRSVNGGRMSRAIRGYAALID